MVFPFSSHGEQLLAGYVVDSTEREGHIRQIEKSLREKEILLKELHHRVKNHLQSVASLLRLQEHTLTDNTTREMFSQNINRIWSMAMVHEMLYQSGDIASIELVPYLNELITYIGDAMGLDGDMPQLSLKGDAPRLSIEKAVPFGLIMNELLQNAVKYGEDTSAHIDLQVQEGRLTATVSSATDADATDFFAEAGKGFGLGLVDILTSQIGGTVRPIPGPGARVQIEFEIEA